MEQAVKGVEVLGELDTIVDRPEIKFENLDLDKFDKGELTTDGKFYNGLSIPLKFSDSDRILWELVWFYFIDKYVDENGEDDTIPDQPINLQLYIENDQSTDEREYSLSAFIPIDHYGEATTECLTEDIHLSDEEVKAVKKAFSEAANYTPQEEKPVISKPKLTFDELCRKYGNRTNETTTIKPTAFDLYKELKNPNYNSFVIGNETKAKENAEIKVPCFGLTKFKRVCYEKCWGTGADRVRFSDGDNWFLIAGKMESIERTREFGNFQDIFTIRFPDCEESLELVASWGSYAGGNEIE